MSDETICSDIDLVIESLAANGEREEAERLRKAAMPEAERLQEQRIKRGSLRSGQAGTCYRCFLDGYDAGKKGTWIANFAAGYATQDCGHSCDDKAADSTKATSKHQHDFGNGVLCACGYQGELRMSSVDATSQSPVRRETVPRYSAFDVSNSILDVIDEGYVVNGHRFSWKFDSGNEVFADSQKLDFRDKILAKLVSR